MTRTLVVLLVVGLVLAPAAVAKGPHAVMKWGADAAEPGKAWTATVELNEFRRVSRPSLTARLGDRTVTAEVRELSSSIHGAAFELKTVFPTKGSWKLMLVAGKDRFRFPALAVGSGEVPRDYVSFPIGSEAARHGGGGVYLAPEPVDTSAGGVQPPETFIAATAESADGGGSGGGLGPWLFPLLGVVAAGAGIATLRWRGSR